ncbi:MAG TPA: C39 family peptidase [Meiothermus sp.]|nr:C39 family peptidase [Meiothermus sp.]
MHSLAPALLLSLALASLATAQPASIRLEGVRHEYQRFNNCGPVTVGMAMSFWGNRLTQYQIAPVLKPNKADKNVSPEELATYARSKGYRVHYGVAGDLSLLKQLLAAGFAVIAESGFVVPEHGWMGHYRLLVGYEDRSKRFFAFDSYYGPKVTLGYSDFDEMWSHFNRTYLVVYPPEEAGKVEQILGQRTNPDWMWKRALEVALSQTKAEPKNVYAWFNLGTALLEQGNVEGAVEAYDKARSLGWPWRMLWYQFGPLEAYYQAGRYTEVVRLASANLAKAPDLEESLYWRGRAQAALGNLRLAKTDLQIALKFRPSYSEAAQALKSLDAQSSR